jgi:2-furoyl-CoA dehydrogenase FAD binding subunit
MKPAPFDYIRVESVRQTTEALAQYGDEARILAGGQSLIAMLNMRLAQPRLLVDVSHIDGMDRIEVSPRGEHLTIHAAATQSALLAFPDLATTVPLLAKAIPHVGHFQTRNKGTVCGSIAHADPSSELPLCMAVLDGTIHLAGEEGAGDKANRAIAGGKFFTGLLQTDRTAGEMITHIRFPLAKSGEGYAFNEMAIRHGDFALVAVAVKATATSLRIGIGGAADKPHVRDWPILDGSALDDALNALAWELEFQEDAHATPKYRRHLVRTLGRRAVLEAIGYIQSETAA